MNITVVSSFRNSSSYLFRYFKQMEQLRAEAPHLNFNYVLGYGDCQDDTQELLGRLKPDNTNLVDVTHGGPSFGSVVHPQRFNQLAYVGNCLLAEIDGATDYVLFIESDLVWMARDLACLLGHAQALHDGERDPLVRYLLAPMIKHYNGLFYDTWAFRKDGMNFNNQPPYHPSLVRTKEPVVEMDSVGSCFVAKTDLVKQVYFPSKDVIVGLCTLAKQVGTKIYMDRTVEVFHP